MAAHYWDVNNNNLTFLDLGCGTGASTLFLAKKGFKVLSVDISKTACQKLNDNLSSNEKHLVEIIDKDVLELELDDESVDCILLINIIDVILDIQSAVSLLDKVRRWLKPEGRIFSTVLHDFPESLSRDRLIIVRTYTIEELQKVFASFKGSLSLVTTYVDQLKYPVTNWVLDLEKGI
jgi:ubiquinone/menaquinone biosynthesis C-methylase UbiE